jgi:hypothetical protein
VGAGFTKALDKKSDKARIDYLNFIQAKKNKGYTAVDLLGTCVFTYMYINNDQTWTCVVSMIAQDGVKNKNNTQPINYKALELCLMQFTKHSSSNNCIVQMPRIGCGLAGGEWHKIEPLINKWSINPTYVYDF